MAVKISIHIRDFTQHELVPPYCRSHGTVYELDLVCPWKCKAGQLQLRRNPLFNWTELMLMVDSTNTICAICRVNSPSFHVSFQWPMKMSTDDSSTEALTICMFIVKQLECLQYKNLCICCMELWYLWVSLTRNNQITNWPYCTSKTSGTLLFLCSDIWDVRLNMMLFVIYIFFQW